MLKFGADVICKSAGKQLSDTDIDAIVSRSGSAKSAKGKLSSKSTTDDGEEQQIFQDQQHSALDYNPLAAPSETRQFEGSHFDKYGPDDAMMKQVMEKQEEQQPQKRQRTGRLVDVVDDYGKKHQVFRNNMYNMEEGITSVFDQEYANDSSMKASSKVVKRKIYRAGHDYENEDFCLECWDGGDLMCCDRCPAAYHENCLSKAALKTTGWVSCCLSILFPSCDVVIFCCCTVSVPHGCALCIAAQFVIGRQQQQEGSCFVARCVLQVILVCDGFSFLWSYMAHSFQVLSVYLSRGMNCLFLSFLRRPLAQ